MSSKHLYESVVDSESVATHRKGPRRHPRIFFPALFAFCTLIGGLSLYGSQLSVSGPRGNGEFDQRRIQHPPFHAQRILSQCAALKATVGLPEAFSTRNVSDRFEPGTNSTLIRNANIWTGARNGTETVVGDVLLEGGVVKRIGYIPHALLVNVHNLTIVEANGAWVTPGLVDLHSHMGQIAAPFVTFELNSPAGPIVPWLRSIDGIHTHDDAYELAIAGGVTSAQILPGSANAIAGQAFIIKLRKTSERSASSMLLEPPLGLNGSEPDPDQPLRWRHLKQACGENLDAYGSRMDTIWFFRSAYDTARKVMQSQDDYCMKAEAGLWNEIRDESFPESFQWEALVDVLRGRVKISQHCYEEVDLDAIVRLSNEFKFHVASFHHAAEAWLVPGLLKRMFGGPPAVAMFASNHRYKREAYRGSVYAPRVLADNDIPVVMKTDHPAVNGRYLLFEAQQAHYYGLPAHLALSSITSTPAQAAGLAHRIGSLQEGVDADVVLWDSHPLQLGATPRQVWIDGIPQLKSTAKSTVLVGKQKTAKSSQEIPRVPKWDFESQEAVDYDGLPPLEPRRIDQGTIVLKNVRQVWMRGELGLKERWVARPGQEGGVVVLQNGAITCVGKEGWCFDGISDETSEAMQRLSLDLQGGSVGPGMMTFGSPLGLEEISGEPSTGHGSAYNAFKEDTPKIIDDPAGLTRAVDALQFQTRNALLAYRGGVTYATSSLGKIDVVMGPNSIIAGLAATFRTGAANALDHNAIVKDVTALHMMIFHPSPFSPFDTTPPISVSTVIATLRRLLLNAESSKTETGRWFKRAAEGSIPLVIQVDSADIMATLLNLKSEIEEKRGSHMKLVFAGASEAHLLAKQIASAKVGVILTDPRPRAGPWGSHRILAGPPVTNASHVSTLLQHGVTVALGSQDASAVANARFEAGWVDLDAEGIHEEQLWAMVTTNLERLLGMEGWIGEEGDLVVYYGGSPFDFNSKVVAVASPKRGVVDLL